MIVLNGGDEVVDQMIAKMQIRAGKQQDEKRLKKANKKSAASTSTASSVSPTTISSGASTSAVKQEPSSSKASSSSESKVKPKTESLFLDPTAAAASSKSTIGKHFKLKRERDTEVLVDPAMKKLKDSKFSVASDPKASEIYKSLFTSHKSEQEQTRAHWVTYNPFYN